MNGTTTQWCCLAACAWRLSPMSQGWFPPIYRWYEWCDERVQIQGYIDKRERKRGKSNTLKRKKGSCGSSLKEPQHGEPNAFPQSHLWQTHKPRWSMKGWAFRIFVGATSISGSLRETGLLGFFNVTIVAPPEMNLIRVPVMIIQRCKSPISNQKSFPNSKEIEKWSYLVTWNRLFYCK